MRLKSYLAANNTAASEFARTIDVSVQSVFRYLASERVPSRPVMQRIVAATAGNVTANDFYGITTLPCDHSGENAA